MGADAMPVGLKSQIAPVCTVCFAQLSFCHHSPEEELQLKNFEETIMENKNVDNISDSAVPVDHTEMPVDDTATPVTPVEMAVGPDPPVVFPVRPSDSSATRSDYTHKRGSAAAVHPPTDRKPAVVTRARTEQG